MDKFKVKLSKIKVVLHTKLSKIKDIKANTIADLLVYLAFFIIFCTTFLLNKYIGMYVLAVLLLILSYFTAISARK